MLLESEPVPTLSCIFGIFFLSYYVGQTPSTDEKSEQGGRHLPDSALLTAADGILMFASSSEVQRHTEDLLRRSCRMAQLHSLAKARPSNSSTRLLGQIESEISMSQAPTCLPHQTVGNATEIT